MLDLRLLLVAGLVALCHCQYDATASQYEAENPLQPPIKKSLLFSTTDLSLQAAQQLPEANIVVGIMSAPDNFVRREAVRASWATLQSLTDTKLNHLSLEDKEKMVLRFIVGIPKDPEMEKLLAKETAKYRDIVRVPVQEDWLNLTSKTGEFFKWAINTYNFKWAFKCDDDSFVRIDLLLESLRTHGTERVYMGKMWTGTPVDRRVDKYSTSNKYSSFAAGAGYALSRDLVDYVVRNYNDLHKWVEEDVTVGMWMSALNAHFIDNPHFHSLPEGCDKDMIVQNPASVSVMHDTFFNTIKGVPCHAKPDPFDPSTKNVTDHIFLELGLRKVPAPHRGGEQMMLQGDEGAMNDGGMDNEEDDSAEAKFDDGSEGMAVDVMNGNRPSPTTEVDMNNGNAGMAAKATATEDIEKMNAHADDGDMM